MSLLDEQHAQPGEKIGQVSLRRWDWLLMSKFVQALAEQMNMPIVTFSEDTEIASETLDAVTDTMAQMYRVIPVKLEENSTHRSHICNRKTLAIQDQLTDLL